MKSRKGNRKKDKEEQEQEEAAAMMKKFKQTTQAQLKGVTVCECVGVNGSVWEREPTASLSKSD